ncbi:MAG TPA: RNB domain-containing ribonuclease [Solirubrobacteraceae bacterium]|nr:RNB domain-containing ribonuclease [Solirubrobacteraceae bacterium]
MSRHHHAGGGRHQARPRHAAPLERGGRGGPSERPAQQPLVVLLGGRGRFLTGERFFERGGGRLTIGQGPREAQAGRLALVAQPPRGARAKVLRVLGRPDVARDVLEALMLDRGLRRRFPAGVLAAADEAREHPAAAAGRRDLRDLPTFTIDPVTARDFDDAISAQDLGGGRTRVWVHIADVGAFVRPGEAIDREAYRRGTSVYVPGLVEPMLPEALSNDVCSLVPGVDRLAVTTELEFEGAHVARASFQRSVIRSDARLDYEQVDRIFAGEEAPGERWAASLAAARRVAAARDAERRQGGHALSIESVEPEFAFDLAGHVTSAARSVQTESHRLIEHLMIAANEAVARVLDEHRVPTLYRVHERPEPDAVERLLAQLASLDVPTPPAPERMSSTQAAEIVAEASLLVDEHVERTGHGRVALTYLVLRSLKQAHYSPHNLGHAGLGLTHYCHFTSPIRRYPDLVCHRALLSAVGGGEDAPRAAGLEEGGVWCSAREREAMAIERAADDVARCFLLERRLFEEGWDAEFQGEVTGMVGSGAFVSFGDREDGAGAFEGFLPVRRMPGEWWELNEEGTILVGTRRGGALRLGDPVQVRVERVDTARGRVDLVPAGHQHDGR